MEALGVTPAQLAVRSLLLPAQTVLIGLCAAWSWRWRSSPIRPVLTVVFALISSSAFLRIILHVFGIVSRVSPVVVPQPATICLFVVPQALQVCAYLSLTLVWVRQWGNVSEESTLVLKRVITAFTIFAWSSLAAFVFGDCVKYVGEPHVILGAGSLVLIAIDQITMIFAGSLYIPVTVTFVLLGISTWKNSMTTPPLISFRIVACYLFVAAFYCTAMFTVSIAAAFSTSFVSAALYDLLEFGLLELPPLFGLLWVLHRTARPESDSDEVLGRMRNVSRQGRWRQSLYAPHVLLSG